MKVVKYITFIIRASFSLHRALIVEQDSHKAEYSLEDQAQAVFLRRPISIYLFASRAPGLWPYRQSIVASVIHAARHKADNMSMPY